MSGSAALPIHIVTGFLGAGKTTFINALLRDAALAGVLIVVNEIGEIGLDPWLYEKIADDAVLLSSGCLCCELRGDLVDALEDQLRRRDEGALPPYSRVVIETSGLADPAPILHALVAAPTLARRLRLAGVATLIDAVNGLATLDAHPEARRQLALADLVVVTKLDLVADASALFERIHADGFRVALSGEGADELFAGYVPLEIAFAHGRDSGDFVRGQTLANMSRTNLQRLDRTSMKFQIEAREPLLDSSLAAYALSLDAGALVGGGGAGVSGKRPLRELFALYPDQLPTAIARRRKVALHVGSGLDTSQNASPWIDFAEAEVSDAEFAQAKCEFALYQPTSKEEALSLRLLSQSLDLKRVPHLAARPFLRFPRLDLGEEAASALRDYLAAA